MLTIELSAEAESILEAQAKAEGSTKAEYARHAVLTYLEDQEDIAIAEERLKEISEGKSKTIPLEEVMRRHGMDIKEPPDAR